MLRSWEAEFPDLGMSKSADSPRVYRRADVERVLRLKHLLFVDGLTLAGARKQMALEGDITPAPADEEEVVVDEDVASLMDEELRRGLRDVRQGLRYVLGVLNGGATDYDDERPSSRASGRKIKIRSAAKAKPVKSKAARAAARPAKKAKPARAAKKAAKKRR